MEFILQNRLAVCESIEDLIEASNDNELIPCLNICFGEYICDQAGNSAELWKNVPISIINENKIVLSANEDSELMYLQDIGNYPDFIEKYYSVNHIDVAGVYIDFNEGCTVEKIIEITIERVMALEKKMCKGIE